MPMLTWIINHPELLAQWATIVGVPVAIFGGFLAYGQLRDSASGRKWQNYNEMNVRYAELYKDIPDALVKGAAGDFAAQDAGTQRWVRQYFDLNSEEYWLYLNNLIPREMWTRRIAEGIAVNLKRYPLLMDGFRYWTALGSFSHPDGFKQVIEQAIAKAQGRQA